MRAEKRGRAKRRSAWSGAAGRRCQHKRAAKDYGNEWCLLTKGHTGRHCYVVSF